MTEAHNTALVERCLAGDELALAQFVERFQQRIFGLCLKMLGHRQDAEDVAQESMVRAIRYLENWDRSRPLEPWVLMIAANRCRTARERGWKRHVTSETILESAAARTAPHQDLGEELDRALSQVRPEYRDCFILFHLQELSIIDISELLQVPEGTVKTWLHRARKDLAELLTNRGLNR